MRRDVRLRPTATASLSSGSGTNVTLRHSGSVYAGWQFFLTWPRFVVHLQGAAKNDYLIMLYSVLCLRAACLHYVLELRA